MKKTQLLLTNPCTENWGDMTPSAKGRYCEVCTKNIVDLTQKSDKELIEFFKKKNENVCGRLLASQLNRDLVIPKQKSNWNWLIPFAYTAILIPTTKASDLRPITQQASTLKVDSEVSKEYLEDNQVNRDSTIAGTVRDQDGKPLTDVKIKWVGYSNVLAKTDSLGRFNFTISSLLKDAKLQFELDGYSSAESKLGKNLNIYMSKFTKVMLGGISTITTTEQPLYIVYSGKKSCTINKQILAELSPAWIEKLDILKDEKATSLYGQKGKNGVVIIIIKKEYAHKVDFSKKDKQ